MLKIWNCAEKYKIKEKIIKYTAHLFICVYGVLIPFGISVDDVLYLHTCVI